MITEIKSREPNAELVKRLKDFLAQAEAGEIRSMFYVMHCADQRMPHGWCLGEGVEAVKFLGAVSIASHDFMTGVQLTKWDSELVQALEE